ncbi:uncharacterized protein LY79DRAFT_564389 [Colletotrichum navitas]|uniref:Uncharacterized protein n=1 Tax=Colletotrichum navitas TaxID=681940 RepID=A0AAD8PRI3_9PEZI|nr:uncharacterized protein LY79DRAFT_564389 [Colletotrichum navitas]KAK1579393.1 hypothetical protein LY79DRAFT_564389 [Colletotrichum navitas]
MPSTMDGSRADSNSVVALLFIFRYTIATGLCLRHGLAHGTDTRTAHDGKPTALPLDAVFSGGRRCERRRPGLTSIKHASLSFSLLYGLGILGTT